MSRGRIALVVGLGVAAFVALLAYAMMGQRQNRVRVCMEYQGQTNCAVASGETRELSQRTAVDTACATIASGVTDTIACTGSRPKSVEWLE